MKKTKPFGIRWNNDSNKDPGRKNFRMQPALGSHTTSRCSICMAKNLPSNIFLVTFFIWYDLHSTSLEFLSSVSFLHRYLSSLPEKKHVLWIQNLRHGNLSLNDGWLFGSTMEREERTYFFALCSTNTLCPSFTLHFVSSLYTSLWTFVALREFILFSRARLIPLPFSSSQLAANFYKTLIYTRPMQVLIFRMFIRSRVCARVRVISSRILRSNAASHKLQSGKGIKRINRYSINAQRSHLLLFAPVNRSALNVYDVERTASIKRAFRAR